MDFKINLQGFRQAVIGAGKGTLEDFEKKLTLFFQDFFTLFFPHFLQDFPRTNQDSSHTNQVSHTLIQNTCLTLGQIILLKMNKPHPIKSWHLRGCRNCKF